MLQNNPEEAASISFLPLACMCLFIAAFSLGFGPIPWLMMSELFAPEVKGVTSSISGNYAFSSMIQNIQKWKALKIKILLRFEY